MVTKFNNGIVLTINFTNFSIHYFQVKQGKASGLSEFTNLE